MVWSDVEHSRESFNNIIKSTWNLTKHYAYDDFYNNYCWLESDNFAYKVVDPNYTGNRFVVTIYDSHTTDKLIEIQCMCWDLVYQVVKLNEKHKYKTFAELKEIIENISLYDLPKYYYKKR